VKRQAIGDWARIARLHQLDAIFAIFGASDDVAPGHPAEMLLQHLKAFK
jgi:hypothetical protein